MARTRKDRPYWIADKYKIVHHWTCAIGRSECDLPAIKNMSIHRRHTRCWWYPLHSDRRRGWCAPPQWYVNHVWNAPERLRERVTLRNAQKDYRANGDTEIEPDPRQHRHCAEWLWS